MDIFVNGEERRVADGCSLRDALELVGVPADRGGIAVAVNARVIPRTDWDTPLHTADRIEVIHAVQGG